MEKDFTTTAKLRLEVNGQINKINKLMHDDAKKWQKDLKEMKEGCTSTAKLADLKTEVNGRINNLNKSMLNDAKQWRKQLEEMKDEHVNSVAKLSSDLHKLNGHCNIMNETDCPSLNKEMCEVIEEQLVNEEIIELKASEQSNKIISEITSLPATFKLSNFNEIKSTKLWYSSYFFVHDGSYLMNFTA